MTAVSSCGDNFKDSTPFLNIVIVWGVAVCNGIDSCESSCASHVVTCCCSRFKEGINKCVFVADVVASVVDVDIEKESNAVIGCIFSSGLSVDIWMDSVELWASVFDVIAVIGSGAAVVVWIDCNVVVYVGIYSCTDMVDCIENELSADIDVDIYFCIPMDVSEGLASVCVTKPLVVWSTIEGVCVALEAGIDIGTSLLLLVVSWCNDDVVIDPNEFGVSIDSEFGILRDICSKTSVAFGDSLKPFIVVDVSKDFIAPVVKSLNSMFSVNDCIASCVYENVGITFIFKVDGGIDLTAFDNGKDVNVAIDVNFDSSATVDDCLKSCMAADIGLNSIAVVTDGIDSNVDVDVCIDSKLAIVISIDSRLDDVWPKASKSVFDLSETFVAFNIWLWSIEVSEVLDFNINADIREDCEIAVDFCAVSGVAVDFERATDVDIDPNIPGTVCVDQNVTVDVGNDSNVPVCVCIDSNESIDNCIESCMVVKDIDCSVAVLVGLVPSVVVDVSIDSNVFFDVLIVSSVAIDNCVDSCVNIDNERGCSEAVGVGFRYVVTVVVGLDSRGVVDVSFDKYGLFDVSFGSNEYIDDSINSYEDFNSIVCSLAVVCFASTVFFDVDIAPNVILDVCVDFCVSIDDSLESRVTVADIDCSVGVLVGVVSSVVVNVGIDKKLFVDVFIDTGVDIDDSVDSCKAVDNNKGCCEAVDVGFKIGEAVFVSLDCSAVVDDCIDQYAFVDVFRGSNEYIDDSIDSCVASDEAVCSVDVVVAIASSVFFEVVINPNVFVNVAFVIGLISSAVVDLSGSPIVPVCVCIDPCLASDDSIDSCVAVDNDRDCCVTVDVCFKSNVTVVVNNDPSAILVVGMDKNVPVCVFIGSSLAIDDSI